MDFGFSYTDPIDSLTGHSPQFAAPEQLEARRLTQAYPDQRYPSATEALSALEHPSTFHWLKVAVFLLIPIVGALLWLTRPQWAKIATKEDTKNIPN